MTTKKLGRQTVALAHPPSVAGHANVVGKKEGEGPLADSFDQINQDDSFGEKTWEKAESAMQKTVLQRALEKAELTPEDLDYILAGDLLNQCIGSSFGLRDFRVPFYGLYGACSTMGESLSLAALLIDGGFARLAAAMTSSLLGEEGSIVSIKYLTPLREEQSFEITHANYTTPSISTVRLMDNGVGYLRIDSFTSGTAVEFRNAVNSLTNQGATSLIFDLRDNSGENLNAALVATDYCVPSGLIAQSQDKGGNVTDLRMSDENEITLPMVCLVNGSTASGAELFANALRKMAGATIVGSTTAGKGVLLSDPQSLSDGSAVVITVGILLDNEGKNWNGTGLTPDVDASLTNDEQSSYYDFTVDNDPQIAKAINAISGANGQ